MGWGIFNFLKGGIEYMENYNHELKNKKVLVGITGSIAAIGIFPYLSILHATFDEVKVVMSKSSCQFIKPEIVRLFCNEVFLDEDLSIKGSKGHVEIAKWADLMMVIPTTANTIAKVAYGFANDLLSSVILAHNLPVIFFPNMNILMWEKNVVQHNIELIKAEGHIVINPIKTEAYEIASGSVKLNYVLPNYQEVINIIFKEIQNRKVTTIEV